MLDPEVLYKKNKYNIHFQLIAYLLIEAYFEVVEIQWS